ncbi:hypothetical protein [Desulfotruncus alcoholivorax]|uniref:hypothetical protein n=1 Tax=Desulfotruncus alcoholivorax TaxID=265477 RepID=UPI0004192A0C|nr:hypothetical protein [Desulfotruncus alcoholivorax]
MALMRNFLKWMERNLEKPFVEIELSRAELNCERKGKAGQTSRNTKTTKIIPLRATK